VEGLTGRRRYVIMPHSHRLALQVEESVWRNGDKDTLGRWENKFRYATSADLPGETIVGLPDQGS